jgi:hypothetical protein
MSYGANIAALYRRASELDQLLDRQTETFHPRKPRLRRPPCNKCPAATSIWTGS